MSERRAIFSHGWKLKIIFTFGIIFVILLVLIAIMYPRPTIFQETIFRVLLALSAAGVAALLPGFITVKLGKFIRAGGALAVFAIVYFFNPPELIRNKPLEHAPNQHTLSTGLFRIYVVYQENGNLISNSYRFPISDIRKKQSGSDFLELLAQLPDIPDGNLKYSTAFRISDEEVIEKSTVNVLNQGNLGVLVIPNYIIEKYGDQHLAFTYIYSQVHETD